MIRRRSVRACDLPQAVIWMTGPVDIDLRRHPEGAGRAQIVSVI